MAGDIRKPKVADCSHRILAGHELGQRLPCQHRRPFRPHICSATAAPQRRTPDTRERSDAATDGSRSGGGGGGGRSLLLCFLLPGPAAVPQLSGARARLPPGGARTNAVLRLHLREERRNPGQREVFELLRNATALSAQPDTAGHGRTQPDTAGHSRTQRWV